MSQAARARQYYLEMGGAMALYIVVLVTAISIGKTWPPGPAQTALYLTPMLPVLLTVVAVVRQFRRSDEFIRGRQLAYLSIAAAITAGWTFTYGFLENAGFPRLSMFTVWPVMGFVWGALACIDNWRLSR